MKKLSKEEKKDKSESPRVSVGREQLCVVEYWSHTYCLPWKDRKDSLQKTWEPWFYIIYQVPFSLQPQGRGCIFELKFNTDQSKQLKMLIKNKAQTNNSLNIREHFFCELNSLSNKCTLKVWLFLFFLRLWKLLVYRKRLLLVDFSFPENSYYFKI